MEILLFIGFVVIAIVFFLWMLKEMLVRSCPKCQQEENIDTTMIPIIPGFLWWCINCNTTTKQKDLAYRRDIEEANEE